MINTQMSNQSSLEVDYCPECGEKTSTIVEFMGAKKKVPCMCKCKREEYEKQRELDMKVEQQRKLDRLTEYSLMDKSFMQYTFGNFKTDKYNKDLYKLAVEYCNEWTRMKKENTGMILMGPPGVGKSYLSFCIANELLNKFVPVIAISTIGIINKIYSSYNSYGEEGEAHIINSLKNADLLVLDDLGAEHTSARGKEKQIIYSIIDSRVRQGKPIIITTNLNKQQLREKLISEDRIDRSFDRLTAVAPILEIEGPSRRKEEGNRRFDSLMGLLKK